VNTSGQDRGGTLEAVLRELPAFTQAVGRAPAIVAAYQPWASNWVRNDNLRRVAETYGAIPMISWHCGEPNEHVAAGGADPLITRFAEQMKAYGGPVLLRWYWEANLHLFPECLGPGTPDERAQRYVEAFRHIADVFDEVGATNVAFVWAPSAGAWAFPMETYYPGDQHVDWIGVDGYDRLEDPGGFAEVFDSWYRLFVDRGKPMIVTETGATSKQPDFFREIGVAVPVAYPQLKAIVYFDAVGSLLDWRLGSDGGEGLEAFAELGQMPHFAVMPGQ